MSTSRRQALVALCAMGSAATLAHVAKPTNKLADQGPPLDLEAAFPRSFGRWRHDDRQPVVLPSPDQQEMLNKIYNRVLSRTYVNGQFQHIMLSVAYGGDQSDGMNIHLPEVCYPAQGFQVLSRSLGRLSAGDRQLPVVRLVTRLGGRIEPVTYWITVGDEVVPTRTQQKLTQIRYGLRGLIPDGMLVRVSSIDVDSKAAFALHEAFVADLAPLIPASIAPRVLGGV